jgi:hypothetical protein
MDQDDPENALPTSNVRTVSSAVQICNRRSYRNRSPRMPSRKLEAAAVSPRVFGPFLRECRRAFSWWHWESAH